MYPFLFRYPNEDKWIVKIASFDYVGYDASWMCDDEMKDHMWTPDVDIAYEKHFFDSEKDALDFIRNWWINQVEV